MVDAIRGLFTSTPGVDRINVIGLIVMAISLAVSIFAGKISQALGEKEHGKKFRRIKLACLLVCIVGFIVAMI